MYNLLEFTVHQFTASPIHQFTNFHLSSFSFHLLLRCAFWRLLGGEPLAFDFAYTRFLVFSSKILCDFLKKKALSLRRFCVFY